MIKWGYRWWLFLHHAELLIPSYLHTGVHHEQTQNKLVDWQVYPQFQIDILGITDLFS